MQSQLGASSLMEFLNEFARKLKIDSIILEQRGLRFSRNNEVSHCHQKLALNFTFLKYLRAFPKNFSLHKSALRHNRAHKERHSNYAEHLNFIGVLKAMR